MGVVELRDLRDAAAVDPSISYNPKTAGSGER